jgi:subtilisin family serine protease
VTAPGERGSGASLGTSLGASLAGIVLLGGVLVGCVQPGEIPAALACPGAENTVYPATVVATTHEADGRPKAVTFEAVSPEDRDAKLDGLRRSGVRVSSYEPEAVYTTQAINDPVYLGQDPGDPPGQYGVDKVRAEAAWGSAPLKQGQGVKVAVVDTGVQADHPDLTGRVLQGADFVDGSRDDEHPELLQGSTNYGRIDPNGHGTHVAGTIGASDNAIGGIGIAPQVSILPVRVLAANGAGFSADVGEGVIWAADQAASVINLSVGATNELGCFMQEAIVYAIGKGAMVVAAAGNDGCVLPDSNWCVGKNDALYPAAYAPAYEGLVAVAATDIDDERASFSNVNSYVSIAAPGTTIWSTVPPTAYGIKNGTSMATPHVSGVAALVRAACPAKTPAQVEDILTSTAMPLPDLASSPNSMFGAGLVQADDAVAMAAATC